MKAEGDWRRARTTPTDCSINPTPSHTNELVVQQHQVRDSVGTRASTVGYTTYSTGASTTQVRVNIPKIA